MSPDTSQAIALSAGFSRAIALELTTCSLEAIAVPNNQNAHHEIVDVLSVALAFEIEQTFMLPTLSRFAMEDKCERFAATLTDDEVDGQEVEHTDTECIMGQPAGNRRHTPKKAGRRDTDHAKKRAYVWKKPEKNKGRIHKSPETAKRASEILEDDCNDIDELFEETDEEVIMSNGETEDDEADGREDGEEDLFVQPKLPSTMRQLTILVRKNMDELYELATLNPSKPETIRGYEYTLRQALDKVRLGEIEDLSAEEIVTLHEAIAQMENDNLAGDI